MPIGTAASPVLIRLGLAAVYLLLALALHPLLLEHELALPSDLHHSADLCAWLDHVAGTSLQSALAHLIVSEYHAPLVVQFEAALRSVTLFVDPSRGPPLLI
jgi:hypothetical protein